jgi:hypothetical protein
MFCVIRVHVACSCLFLAFISDVWASADVCDDPGRYSHLSYAFTSHSDSSIGQGPASVGQQNQNVDVQFKAASDKLLFGIGHRYSIFDVDPIQPATNGHLHTYFLPFHKLGGNDDRSFRISIAPAISLSSNVGDRLNEYKDDAFQLLAALIWGRRLSDRVSLRYGICGDHRFGDYQVYPLIGVQWQFHPDWNAQLGFPTSQLSYQLTPNLSSEIRIAPDGNEWFVLDKALTNKSQFVYEAFVIEWTFDWALHESFVISASIGRQIHNRFEMTLLDQSRVRLSGDPVTRVGAALEWRF